MVWIEIDNPQVQSVKLPFMDEAVEFNDTQTAQVSKDVGEQLVEDDRVEGISIRESETDSDNDTETEEDNE
jgi:hypothetical protein